jgi:hypothetical protein
MATFHVVIERVEYLRALILVDADTEEEAREIAPEMADRDDYDCVNAEERVVSVTEADPNQRALEKSLDDSDIDLGGEG